MNQDRYHDPGPTPECTAATGAVQTGLAAGEAGRTERLPHRACSRAAAAFFPFAGACLPPSRTQDRHPRRKPPGGTPPALPGGGFVRM